MRSLLIPLIVLIVITCSSKKPTVEPFHWMAGNWQKVDADSSSQSVEVWQIESDKLMIGYGLTTANLDTLFYEQLKIVVEGDAFYYIADVGQGVVRFKLVASTPESWTFENPEHDFPKRIIYQKSGEKMLAFTEAEGVSIPFEFERVKK